ncbi:MAG: nucleotidyltransferase family protein [Deltaproteobacteria bacterium]|nr:nucleotidyltransferase family protein [Deltaproteobacteria bacterium]
MLNGFARDLRAIGTPDRRLLDLLLDVLRAEDARHASIQQVVDKLRYFAAQRVYDVLAAHRLHHLWYSEIAQRGLTEELHPALDELLGHSNRLALARSLAQESALTLAAEALDAMGACWLVFKGRHIAGALYEDASVRSSVDIDILVDPAHRDMALRALAGVGFEQRREASTHEVSLLGHNVWIDLHWHLLRPGRARKDLGRWLLDERVRQDSMWVPSDSGGLVVLLVHPAVTEHVTTFLSKGVDLDRWLRVRKPAIEPVVAQIDAAGLKTAAWSMLEWTRFWLATPLAPKIAADLAPGRARRAYLRGWLALSPGHQYAHWPNLVRGGFSLALQDRISDMARALATRAWSALTAAKRT